MTSRLGAIPMQRGTSATGRATAARRLRDLLRAELLRGGYPDGRLPSELELMAAYGASRGTVRDALSLLRDEGLVRRLTGTGTLVIADPAPSRLSEFHGFAASQDASPLAIRPLEHARMAMSPMIARLLDRPIGADCLAIEYIALRGSEPLAMVINYVAWPHAEALVNEPQRIDFFSYLRENGLTVGRTDMIFDARPADASVAALLQIPEGSPLLGFEQVIVDDAGIPYDFAVGYARGDRMRLFSQASTPR